MKHSHCETLTVEEAMKLLAEGRKLQDLLLPRLQEMQRITSEDLKEKSHGSHQKAR
jgi:hypothetical protein